MAIFFALVLIVCTVGLVYPLLAKMWWIPFLASQQGAGFDQHFLLSIVMCAIIFVPAQLVLAYVIVRYADRKGAVAGYSHGNNTFEALWTGLALVFFLGMNAAGQKMWAAQRFDPAPENSLQVEVTGEQFAWNMRYAGPDGQFGKTSPALMDNSSGNPLGIDPNDPLGKDDIVSPTLVVPVNRPLEILLRSKDVTHNFFVREMRIKQDAVPGMELKIHFTPTVLTKDRPTGGDSTKDYEIACSELCGLGHYKMRSYMRVVTEEEFAAWLKSQAR